MVQISYLRNLKTALVKSLRDTFTETYPDPRLQNLLVSIEFPIKAQDYPSVWVNFDEASLVNAGIDHYEVVDNASRILRWRFQGTVSFTIVALSSLERDRIYDEMIKIMAFTRKINSDGTEESNAFRTAVESNPYIAMNMNLDEIEPQGDNAAPGTPWQTDEIIYEKSFGMEVLGEFTTDLNTGSLVPLSEISIQGRVAPSTEDAPVGELDWSIHTNIDPTEVTPWI